MKLGTLRSAPAIAASVASPTASSVSSQLVSPAICATLVMLSACREPTPAMAEMTSQSATVVVSMAESNASSWLNTVGHLLYVHGVKTLLITPVFSPHAPVRMALSKPAIRRLRMHTLHPGPLRQIHPPAGGAVSSASWSSAVSVSAEGVVG